MSKTFLGIDPGANGACVLVDEDADIRDWFPMPTAKVGKGNRRILDELILAVYLKPILQEAHCALVAIEEQHAYPKQGAVSTFTLGWFYGGTLAVVRLAGFRVELVTPKRWKEALGVRGTGRDGKAAARLVATRLWPDLPPEIGEHDGAVDALLIAEWARRHAG